MLVVVTEEGSTQRQIGLVKEEHGKVYAEAILRYTCLTGLEQRYRSNANA